MYMSTELTINEQLIRQFYTGFQNMDYKSMQACYADNAVFDDAVFSNLNATEVKAMWEMLCKRGKDFKLEFSDIKTDNNKGSANWVATYLFSSTGKKVTNKIHAEFEFENGKIIKHTDQFNFYKWAKQAFGLTGVLIGWTSFFKNKVRHTAKLNLLKFMQ